MSIITSNTSIKHFGILLLNIVIQLNLFIQLRFIIASTVIKHVRDSFDIILCSLSISKPSAERPAMKRHLQRHYVLCFSSKTCSYTFASEAEPQLFLACS